MAPHMKKLTNIDTQSLFDEGWTILGFMDKYLVCWVKNLLDLRSRGLFQIWIHLKL